MAGWQGDVGQRALGLSTRCRGEDALNADDLRRIAAVGAGLMGHGIAQEFAWTGCAAGLHSRTEASLQKAFGNRGAISRRWHTSA